MARNFSLKACIMMTEFSDIKEKILNMEKTIKLQE